MKAYSKHWSIVAIGLALLPASLRAEFVYVANFISNDVSVYTIGTNGALTPVPGSPFPTGLTLGYSSSVAVDPLNRVVYVTNTGNPAALGSHGSVSAFRIGAGGALTAVPGSPFTAENYSSSVAVDVLRRVVYVANAGDPAFKGNTGR